MALIMHIIDNKVKRRHKMPTMEGEIIIGDFQETFLISLEYWGIEDYKRQWAEGLDRIKIHEQSCLVSSVQDPTKAPWLNWWVLYKEGAKIFIQNQLFVNELYKVTIGKSAFTPETCYKYISPRITHTDEGEEISEWSISLPHEQHQ
jgi:CdiI N-terminal domain